MLASIYFPVYLTSFVPNLFKFHHVSEGFIEQNIFATKAPRHQV